MDGPGASLPRIGRRGDPAHQKPDERRAAYAADITYGTNNEFGFDYLRDNMVHSSRRRFNAAQLRHRRRGRLDPVDEARTPLIISGPPTTPSAWYDEFAGW